MVFCGGPFIRQFLGYLCGCVTGFKSGYKDLQDKPFIRQSEAWTRNIFQNPQLSGWIFKSGYEDMLVCFLAVCYWPFISQSGGFQIWISNLDIKICRGVSGLLLTVYKSI